MQKKWWKEAIGYQIYPKSFYDSNNDGIGDLKGIIQKLDYLQDLGVNMLWLCPFYKSPMDDNGYDVSDYYDVAPEFGTMDDLKELIQKAHDKGIRIIADLVLNHTSDEHPWFIESRKSTDNEYRDFYYWRPGRTKDGQEIEPTNWASFFGGSAWKKDEITGEYFMKIFSNKMPDLNWESQALRTKLYEMVAWWLDLGIDGFRVDAISHIARDQSFSDSDVSQENGLGYKMDWSKFSNLPDVHTYIKELNQQVLSKYDIMTVGEVGGGAKVDDALKFAGYDSNEFNMVFNFDHNWCNGGYNAQSYSDLKTNLIQLKQTFNYWQQGMFNKGWHPIYWLNHDHPRVLSMYGDINYHYESATMLATALYMMWGTPFIYQGEEIGMSNYPFTKIEEFDDVAIHNQYPEAVALNQEQAYINSKAIVSRDNARTPMQWNTQDYAGFSKTKPWMNVNPNYEFINVEDQINDPNSVFNYYKKVIRLKKDNDILIYGSYQQLLGDHKQVYAYIRTYQGKTWLVICNFFKEPVDISLRKYHLKLEQVILNNYGNPEFNLNKHSLLPFEAIVLEVSFK